MKKKYIIVGGFLATLAIVIFAMNFKSPEKKEMEGLQALEEQTYMQADSGLIDVMTNDKFIKEIFDYKKNKTWTYKGNKPIIIDMYADWCGPCRKMIPVIRYMAKMYKGQILFYKTNVDKEKDLANLFQATSIPLFVFIPTKGEPRVFNGATDKATFLRIINEFLLKNEPQKSKDSTSAI